VRAVCELSGHCNFIFSFLYVSYIIFIDIFSIDRGFSKTYPYKIGGSSGIYRGTDRRESDDKRVGS